MADDRIITALDVHSLDDMKKLVETLGDSVSFYKVGMELFYSAGPDAVRYLKDQGKHVFLDLKVHDIPNTVAQSIRALTRLGADLMTLHGTGGRAMMEAAAEAVRDEAAKLNIERPRLLAVTVLTSIDEDAWKEIGGKYSIAESVKNLAKLAKEAGIDGTVSSPYEAKEIREMNGPDFLIVTPGIRPTFAVANDQKRFTTPSQALCDGASHLVIGRPITKAADPKEAAQKILAEIQGVESIMMTEAEVRQLLVDTKAVLEGHFLLTSGLHSPLYVEKFNVLQHPEYTEKLCKELAERFKDQNVQTVMGPMTGGILLAHEVGKALGTRAIFTEREKGVMTLRRGFHIEPGERVLIVEDIVTTGGSVQEVVNVVKKAGGVIVGVGLLVDRSGGKAEFGVPKDKVQALLHLTVPTYKPEECPLCKQGIPMTERGSHHLK